MSDGIIVGGAAASALATKRAFYDKMYVQARRTVRGKVDGRERRAAVGEMVRG